MKEIIFYGAGRNAVEKLNHWVEQGLIPVCFCDSDTSKHYTQFYCGRASYEILPLQEAIKRYPDYEIYCTQIINLKSITDYLLAAEIPKERIKYCEPVEWRRGCYDLGEQLYLFDSYISACCATSKKQFFYSDKVHTENSIKHTIREFRKWLEQTLENTHPDKPTDCDKCHLFRWDFWKKEPKIRRISVGSGFKNTICNCRCIYCTASKSLSGEGLQELDGYDVHRILLEEFGNSIEEVKLADGEISILPYRDKLLGLIKENRWRALILTNALIFNQDIADMMKDGLTRLNVSLDSGTPSTYHKVKGVNAFAKVVENLEKYAETGGNINLKYIVLPGINDNFDDINGFLDIAKRLKINLITLSNDFFGIVSNESRQKNISEQTFAMFAYFAARCKELKIPMDYVKIYFTKSDCKRMDCLIKNGD